MSMLDTITAALAGRYDIERQLGRGGMATVYLANDPRHDRKVAVKVLRPDLASTLGPERFLREITIAANLTHPHVVPLYDSGEVKGFLYYVMPYVEGETLGERLRREARVSLGQAMQILREVADALSFAPARGVVHRDIKPDNVMMTDRHAVVTDFGVAKAVSGATTEEGITKRGVAVGTPAYMAPEQVAADPHVDHRCDIYAFGTLAYELLTGNPPFTGPSPQVVLAAHVTQAPDPVSTTREDVPRDLESIVMRCLAKEPRDRWQSADELWTALGSVGDGSRYDVSSRTFQLLDEAFDIEGRTPALEALRGWAVVSKVRMGISRDRHELDEGETIARDLLAKSPNQIYGHSLMGYVMRERGNQPEAVKHFERALKIEPNDADSLFYCGMCYMAGGQNAQAAKVAAQFLACDPLSSFAWMLAANTTWFIGKVRDGIDKFETALEIDPLNFIIHWSAGYAHALIDDRKAVAKFSWLEEHQTDNPYTKQLGSLMRGINGQQQESLELIGEIDVAPLDAHQKFHLAESYAMAGQVERGLDVLQEAVDGGFYPYDFIREHCPFLQPLRASPRFASIETLARDRAAAFGNTPPSG